MMLRVCRSCGGEYRDVQADGSLYFHACPPMVNPKYRGAEAENLDALDFYIERPDHRDENPVRDPATGLTRPKREGPGTSTR